MPTEPSTERDRVFRFGPFELSEREGELRKSGVRIKLQEQPFRVLMELAANSGKLVSREDLRQKLWPVDTFVDFDVGLNSAIRKLRQALNDDADSPRYIETLAKRGYRFVAPVADSAAAPQPTSKDSLLGASVSLPSDGTSSATREEIQHKLRRWYWVLAACALALVIYGAFVTWRRANTTPSLVNEQRITANPPEAPVTSAVVSPDGKFVAYADTTGVYIRHIDTGETRALQLPNGFNAAPTAWFPDGTHLLLGTGEAYYGHGLTGTAVTPSVWKVSILGGSPQEFIENASGAAVSPDGSKIAFLRSNARASRGIWVMGSDASNPHRVVEAAVTEASITDGNGTTRQPYSGVSLSGVAWSPDGGRLAYFRRFEAVSPGPTPDRRSLETVDVSSGTSKVVVKISTQLLPVVCWAADGRLLHAYRDDPAIKFGDSGIWSVRVNQKSGEPEGKPVQLSKGAGQIGGLSSSANGRRLVLWRANSFPQVFLTEIDAETGRFKTPRRLTLDENPSGVYAWTFDSRAVLFNSSRSGTFKLYRQDIDQAVPEVLMERRGSFMPRLNPDGTQLLYVAEVDPENPALPRSLMSVPLQGGSPRQILQKRSIGNYQCARSPSKLCLLATLEGSTAHIFSFDPEDGKTQEFATFKVNEEINWSLSPDGSQLALIFHGSERRITFMAVSDKSSHEVELKPWPLLSIDWAADGKRVYIPSQTASGEPVILGLEPNGNHKVLLEGERAAQYWWVIPSPDGRYAALEVVTGANNVWMLDNF